MSHDMHFRATKTIFQYAELLRIIRFTNDEIINDIDNVIGQIRIKIKELKLTQTV